jgi:hypothetical protein
MRETLLMAAGAIALASAAQADFVDVAYAGQGVGQNVTVTSPMFSGNVFAGQIYLNLTNSTGGPNYPNLDGSWIVFCCELPQYVNSNSNPYEVLPVGNVPLTSPMGPLAANAIAEIYTAVAGAQYGIDADLAAAFQIAIWELSIDYAGGPAGLGDASTGNFQVTGMNAGTTAYLAAILAAVGNFNPAWIAGLANESYQDFIIELPAPGAVALLGVAGLIGSRRRRA